MRSTPIEEREEVGCGEREGEMPQVPWQPQLTSQEAQELRVLWNCPSLSGECQRFVLLNGQSLDVGCSRKRGDHGQKESLQLRLTLKRLITINRLLTATCHLLTASPGSEATWLLLKEDGPSGRLQSPQ